ncbi:MAG: acetyl-CoA carboxylase, biotin carboxyl carrier protein [Planctomycetes bacterium TMED75]|nr:acetyl-CoA carboxylase, biotin carboxyl carrier protein [Planctomycetaceae bacterium]OUU96687.1 MAG: acetyl-CoA carboxylase, biotin carboxyl carrier protein [Planctomycetes bacterium TMED75]
MIDIRKLKELVRLMVANDLTELDLRDEQETVTLRRPGPQPAPQMVAPPAPIQQMAAAPAAAPAATPEAAAPEPAADEGLVPIESPMVGTFYASPSPDKPFFVKVGDTITPDTVVCLVEAMKIFNEIKAETSGVVEKILPASGDSVEFGQPLFLIRPN